MDQKVNSGPPLQRLENNMSIKMTIKPEIKSENTFRGGNFLIQIYIISNFQHSGSPVYKFKAEIINYSGSLIYLVIFLGFGKKGIKAGVSNHVGLRWSHIH